MARDQGKVGENKSDVILNVPMACADEGAAVHFIESLRWGEDKTHECPRCSAGSEHVYKVMDRKNPDKRNKDYRWRCRKCGQFHTVRTGTVMEDCRVPMRHWCLAFWRCCASKKGISAKQIQRETGLSYKSALFLMHRVRFALADMEGCKLTGIVEVDETYVGGKPRYRLPQAKMLRGGQKSNYQTRGERLATVFAAVQRYGNVLAKVLPDIKAANLKAAVKEFVDESANLMTDEAKRYRKIGKQFASHSVVNHTAREYVRYEPHMLVTTNTIEGFFSLLKRGVYGTFHNVSKKHLHRYLSEFEFRYNTRKMDDGQRVMEAFKAAQGKRLMYREPMVRTA